MEATIRAGHGPVDVATDADGVSLRVSGRDFRWDWSELIGAGFWTSSSGVCVSLLQLPCRSGLPSGVRGTTHGLPLAAAGAGVAGLAAGVWAPRGKPPASTHTPNRTAPPTTCRAGSFMVSSLSTLERYHVVVPVVVVSIELPQHLLRRAQVEGPDPRQRAVALARDARQVCLAPRVDRPVVAWKRGPALEERRHAADDCAKCRPADDQGERRLRDRR